MIHDSHVWRLELERSSKELRRLAARKRFDARALVRLELTVLCGLYSVWKLAESGLLSTAVLHERLPLTAHRFRRPRDGGRARPELGELYDLARGDAVAHDVLFVCHQMVQNHRFAPDLGERGEGLTGIYLTSLHQRRVALYRIDLEALLGLFVRVASESPERG